MPPHRIRKLPRVPSAQPPPPPQQPRLPKQEYLKLKAIWRGYGPGSNNNRGGRTLAAREAQLAADAKKLVSERELLRVREEDVERLQRETATRSAQSVGISSWAHEFVFGEEGEIMETPMKRSIASMARMLDTDLVDKAATAWCLPQSWQYILTSRFPITQSKRIGKGTSPGTSVRPSV